jgi:hypothetical protein
MRMHGKKSYMRKSEKTSKNEDVPDIDFSGGVRGKYAARYAAGTNVVVLSPEVAEVFPDSMAVNEALRTLVRLSGKSMRIAPRKKRGST